MNKETRSHKGMICPECDHLNMPEDVSDYDDSIEFQCESCDTLFYASCFIHYTWTCEHLD